jgi:hypothetical protein
MNTWNLRDEILAITHRWYLILGFIFLGFLLGWGAAMLWPVPYRATRDIYVGLNAYRSPYDAYAASLAGQSFRMVDDYKNWQMEQLNDLVLSDSFIRETLDQLAAEDAYWSRLTPQDFREMAGLRWRNVGEWHLFVEDEDQARAVDAVTAWETIIYERVSEVVEHARQVVGLDIQMTGLSETRLESELRQTALVSAQGDLSSWKSELSSKPTDQPVSSLDHWNILGVVSQAVSWEPAWDRVLENAPPVGSSAGTYLEWLDAVLAMINTELEILPEQIDLLNTQYAALEGEYQDEASQSFGLASTLDIERDDVSQGQVETIRPVGTLALIGGILGLLSWVFWAFVRIGRLNPGGEYSP